MKSKMLYARANQNKNPSSNSLVRKVDTGVLFMAPPVPVVEKHYCEPPFAKDGDNVLFPDGTVFQCDVCLKNWWLNVYITESSYVLGPVAVWERIRWYSILRKRKMRKYRMQ